MLAGTETTIMVNEILSGDIREIAPTLATGSINCIVTSPPYWGLRDYGVAGQIGLEPTPEEYVTSLVSIFRELRRVLADDGTLWLNLGDTYATGGGGREYQSYNGNVGRRQIPDQKNPNSGIPEFQPNRSGNHGLKSKDLVGIPWRVALALQADGWYLRSDIIWSKPNPMPESVTDRPTKAHEYIFLLAKSERYYYDAEAIKEPQSPDSLPRLMRGVSDNHKNVNGAPGQPPHSMNQPRKNIRARPFGGAGNGKQNANRRDYFYAGDNGYRNKRSVWEITLKPYAEAHFATFPPELIRPCILAGCPAGGVVLDPFFGSGTTGQVCVETGRNWLGVELNPKYIKLAKKRIAGAQPPLIVPGVHVPPNNGLHRTGEAGQTKMNLQIK